MTDHDGLRIRGGMGGITAHLEDLLQAGAQLRLMAAEFSRCGTAVGAIAADPRLGFSGPLSPLTFAAAEAALGAALVGPAGLFALAVRLETLGLGMTATADAYRVADAGAALGLRAAGSLAGRTAATIIAWSPTVPLGAAVGFTAGPALFGRSSAKPAERAPRPWSWLGGVTLALFANHSGFTGRLAPAVPGFVSGVLAAVPGRSVAEVAAATVFHRSGGPMTIRDLVGGIGVLTGLAGRPAPGLPQNTDPGPISLQVRPVRNGSIRPAGDIGELVAGVPLSDRLSPRVHVERIDGGDGRRRWVVSIPGTASWSPVPGRTPFDLTGDIRLMSGDRSSGLVGLVNALRSVGVRKGEPILLVGHSQGGLLAAAASADPAIRGEFSVTHVLTTGAPIGSVPIPDDVQVLSIEHTDDLVPKLDGTANRDRRNWVTVSAPAPTPATASTLPTPAAAALGVPAARREPLWAHNLDLYRTTASQVAHSSDPSIAAWRSGAAPFLAGYRDTATWDVEISRVATS